MPIEILHAVGHQLQTGDVILAAVLALLGSALAVSLVQVLGLLRSSQWAERYTNFAWQVGGLLGLEQAYEFTRGRIPLETDVAVLNAYRVLDFEWRHGFFIESRLERFFLRYHMVMSAVDGFYVFAHVGVTLGVLVWIYVRRRDQYPFVRNLLALTTGIALIVFYVYPTAPPRLLPNYGFVDPAYFYHLVDAGGAQLDSYTYNPYAAMPSLHVGYALVIAWSLLRAERRTAVRALAVLYPPVMAAVVLISGNHWVLDVVGAVITVALAGGVLSLLERISPAWPLRSWKRPYVVLHPSELP
jgi:membrane-associated phospholipid phosphatase